MSIVINGVRLEVPGVATKCWLDDPKLVPHTRVSHRGTFARAIVAHTVHGTVGALKPGGKPSRQDEWYARFQASAEPPRSWDFTVDTDGSVAWSNDPGAGFTWHALQVNGYTIGFEMVQDSDGTMYQDTVVSAVRMINFLTGHQGIQRQVYVRNGQPYAGRIPRLDPGDNGRNLCGVYGHRNVWVKNKRTGLLESCRGPGDPNDHLFVALQNAGYDAFDPLPPTSGGDAEDVRVWKTRQKALLGLADVDVDGIPGPKTRAALMAKGYADGIFVTPR